VIKFQSLYGGINIISPQFRISVPLARLIRKAVAPHIHCDKAAIVGQVGTHLPVPCAPTLRKTMNEEDWAPACVAHLNVGRLNKVELYPTTTYDLVVLHHLPPASCLTIDRHSVLGGIFHLSGTNFQGMCSA